MAQPAETRCPICQHSSAGEPACPVCGWQLFTADLLLLSESEVEDHAQRLAQAQRQWQDALARFRQGAFGTDESGLRAHLQRLGFRLGPAFEAFVRQHHPSPFGGQAFLGVQVLNLPPGQEAHIILDGHSVGVTCGGYLLLADLSPGSHTLEARTEGEKATLTVELQPGEVRRVELALRPVYGSLRLRGWIRGLQAELEGRPISGPGSVSGLRPGRYTLRFRWEGHSWSVPVEVPAGAEVELLVPAHLAEALGMLERWREERTWSVAGGPVTALAFEPGGHCLAMATGDGVIHVWGLRGPSPRRAFSHPAGPVVALAFRSDGHLVSLGADGALRVWDPSRGRELRRLENPAGTAPIQALSPDGRWLAALGADSTLRLYALPEGREVRRLEGDFCSVTALAFSPGGDILLVCDAGGTLWGYDGGSGRLLWTRAGTGGLAGVLAMHPRVPLLALGTSQGLLILEAEGGHPLRMFLGGKAALRAVAFSADGRWLAVGAADGTVRLWDLQGVQAVEPVRPRRLRRALSLTAGLLTLGLLLLTLQPWRIFLGRRPSTPPAGEVCRGGIEAGEILQYLQCYQSPMGALAEPMFRLGQAYNVDPRLMVALAGAATRFGREGPCAQQRNNPWAYRTQGRECQAFRDPLDAAEAVALALWTQVHQKDVKTFEDLVLPWCPDPKDCAGWVEAAGRFYREQGGDPQSSDFRFTSTGRPVLSGKFRIGDAVRVTTAGLRVRQGPGSRFPSIKSVSPPEGGVVIAGPISLDGHIWWGIRYSGGVVGWSIEGGLAPDVSTPTPTPTSTPTPALAGTPTGGGLASEVPIPTPTPTPTPTPAPPEVPTEDMGVWEVGGWRKVATLRGHSDSVSSVTFSPDGKLLASGGTGMVVEVWEVGGWRRVATLIGPGGLFSRLFSRMRSVTFSPDGKFLASGSDDWTVGVWEVGGWRKVATLRGHLHYVSSVTFSPDGELLASGSWDKTVKVWEVGGWREVTTLRGHSGTKLSVTFSPDGKLLASGGGEDSTVKVWEVGRWRKVVTLRGHSHGVSSVTFSPDGKFLASGGEDGTVKVWEVGGWREVVTLRGSEDPIFSSMLSVTFSPDGKFLASGSRDGTVKVWEVGGWREVTTLRWHPNGVLSVTFSPDGKFLVSGGEDGTVKVWKVGG